MIIKKLELQGFKSFPNRTKIVFHPGITVIVGPNGTGKSNIVDAILWVLGGRRPKSLRGERTESIIFHGNEKKAPLGLADVILSLSDDEENMIINHRLFRSGESEYRLNGKLARLKDIHESLLKKAIAEKEYFTIEQGSIELILTSKPTEKRQFLEEAAGTAYYKEKKRQAQNKLENSEQNLIRLEDIIEEVSKAKNSLKRQANAALRYRKLREKIRQVTFLHYRENIEQLEKSKAEVTAHYNRSLSQEKEILTLIKSEEKELIALNRKIWNLEKSIKESQDNLFTLKSELAHSDADLDREEKRIEFFEEKRNKAKLNTKELKDELNILQEELAPAKARLTSLRQSFTQKQHALEKAGQENQTAQEKMAAWGKKVESLREAYLQKFSEHSEFRNEGVKTEKERELIIRQEEKLQLQLEREQTLLQQIEKKLSQNQRALSQVNRQKEEKKRILSEHESALRKINISIENLQNEISELKEKRESTRHHLQVLKKLEEKERKENISQDIPGAIGFLADLVETDPEYAPLIDIFWREEAKSILISSQDFLMNLAGKKIKGNFLLIPPQKKEDVPQELSHHPAVVGFLKSCLKVNSKLKEPLSFLKDAVIVQDIRNAIQLWLQFPSLNYITTKGDLLLSSGLMKLGQKEEGIIALSQEIKSLEEKIIIQDKNILPLTFKVEEMKKEKQKLEEKLQKEVVQVVKEEKKAEEIEKKKILEDSEKKKIINNISLFRSELDVLEGDKRTIIQRGKEFSLKEKKLEEQGKSLKKELETNEKKLALCQKKNSQEEKNLYELKANIDLLQEKIRNLEHQIQTLIQRKKNNEAKINTLQEEIRGCEEEESKLKEKIKDLFEKKKISEGEKNDKEAILTREESLIQNIKGEGIDREKRIQNLREKHDALKDERVKWEVNKAEIDRDFVNLEENCWQDLKKTLREVREEISPEEGTDSKIEEKLEELKEKLQKLKHVNLMAEEEYLVQKKRYDFLLQQKDDLRSSIDTTQKVIKKIDLESKTQFLKALTEVNKSFQEVFSLLFEGGAAELKLQDPTNPLESGIEIIAQPPGKKMQNMMLLSGGEKALTSLAFLFALFRYRPTPFCILDEVDAALDDINLARFLELMKKIKNQTQFIIVTHNFKTMEVADYIYGTTMPEPNVTHLYSLKIEKKKAE